MNQRRMTLSALWAAMLLAALPSGAQQKRVRRIGILSGAIAPANIKAFHRGMAELGWVEGRDYVTDERSSGGSIEKMAVLADELLANKPDLLLTPGNESALALARRTKTIPIVCAIAFDPVGSGLAASLRRPGGNVTGLTNMSRELGVKRLQLLKDAIPRVTHIAVLAATDANSTAQVREIEQAAQALKMRVSHLELREANEIETAFRRGAALGVNAYLMTTGLVIGNSRLAIIERLRRDKLPGMFGPGESVNEGGLMSFGISSEDMFRRAAAYADRILKGAKPGDLPIEQPVKFEFVVNMKAAQAMGLAIPESILLRADRVID